MMVAMLALDGEQDAATVAISVAEDGHMTSWGVLHSAVAERDRKGNLDVTVTTIVTDELRKDDWWRLFVSVLSQGPVGGSLGGGTGALWAALLDSGVSERFLQSVVQTLVPGSSALFLAVPAEAVAAIEEYSEHIKARILVSELPSQAVERMAGAIGQE